MAGRQSSTITPRWVKVSALIAIAVVLLVLLIVPLLISRGASLKLVEDALNGDRILGLVAQKNAESESPGTDGLYSRGTAGRIQSSPAVAE